MSNNHSQEVLARFLTDSIRSVEGALKGPPGKPGQKGPHGSNQQLGRPGQQIPARRATTEVLMPSKSGGLRTLDDSPMHAQRGMRPQSAGRQQPRGENQRHASAGKMRPVSRVGSAPVEPMRRSSAQWESQAAAEAKARLMAAAHNKHRQGVPSREQGRRNPPGTPGPQGRPPLQQPPPIYRDVEQTPRNMKPPMPAPLRPPTAEARPSGPPGVHAASPGAHALKTPGSRPGPRSVASGVSNASYGTNAAWWRERPGESVISYPMTAVTEREQSLTGTELANFMDRIQQLENAVKMERDKRELFQKELKTIQESGPTHHSRGEVTTSGRATAGVPGRR